MHPEAYSYIERIAPLIPTQRHILEIGSYNVNGSVRPLFAQAETYHGIDVRPGRYVDQVINCNDYDGYEQFDVVVSTEMLEHSPEPELFFECAWRSLRNGGVLLLTAAAPERVPHGCDGGYVGTEYYQNIDPDWLAEQLGVHEWTDITIEHYPDRGDIYVAAVKPCAC